MARAAAVSVENSFVKGLITEATGLNFPENAVTDTDNCVFDHTGEVSRRPGIEFESDFQVVARDFDDVAIAEFLWTSVAQDGDKTFLVVQIGTDVSLYEMDTSQQLSSHETFSFDLADHAAIGASSNDIKKVSASFASGNGLLFIAHPNCEPLFVERTSAGSFTVTEIEIRIRDIEGLENRNSSGELIDVDHRPSASEMTDAITYNLLNQGWYATYAATFTKDTYHPNESTLAFFYRSLAGGINVGPVKTGAAFPAESEQWWAYKVPLTPIVDQNGNATESLPLDAIYFYSIRENKDKFGGTQAPKGHYIYNAFNIDRTAATAADLAIYNSDPYAAVPLSTDSLEPETSGSERPSCIAFYAGRVFYAGTHAQGYNTRIYFSRVIQNNRYLGDCFQNQDPTIEEAGDIVATDGGVIEINDVAKVVKLMQVGHSLMVFATNGVWEIAGSQGVGFSTTDYSVSRISETGALSERSFVYVEGTPIWWNINGIWTIRGSQLGKSEVVSLTDQTIRSYYNDIPAENIPYVKGAYNPLTKVVQWLFRSDTTTELTEKFQYDRILNFDVVTGAFYPWSLPDVDLKICGLICISGPSTKLTNIAVTDNSGIFVTDNAGDTIAMQLRENVETSSRFKYITVNTADLVASVGTVGVTFNSGFLDALDSTFSSVTTSLRPYQSVCLGLDGNTYIPCMIGNFDDQFAIWDGAALTAGTLDPADVVTDLETQLGVMPNTAGTWDSEVRLIPFPDSEYFYAHAYQTQIGTNFYSAFALYKIDAAGAFVFQGCRVWDLPVGYLHSYYIHGVGYKGQGANPASSRLLCALSTLDNGCYVLTLPSVNDILSNGNDTGTQSNTEADFLSNAKQVSADQGFFRRDTTTTDLGSFTSADIQVFFVPTTDGLTWSNLTCVYVSEAVIDYYLANPTNPGGGVNWSADMQALVAANSTSKGFLVTQPLTGSTWSVNTSLGSPFGDEGKDRSGSAASNNRGQWMTPTLKYDSDHQLYLLSWVRRYDNTSANLATTGAYHRAIVYTYDPETQLVTQISDVSGNTYDTVADLGLAEINRNDFCPMNVFLIWNSATDHLYIWSYNVSSGQRFSVLSDFGDFNPPILGSVNISFSEFNNEDTYLDWESVNAGTDFTSYFVTGYKLRGQGLKRFQTNYINLYCRNDVNSTFDFQSRWDYATSGNTGRWSGTQRVSITSGTYAFQRRRLLLRGTGLACQFFVSSVSGEPMNIIGWAAYDTGNQSL